MSTNKLSLFLAAVVALSVPGAALAQHGMSPAGPGAPGMGDPKMQALMQAQVRIMQAQQKALADPGIVKERDAVQKTIEAEMKKLDPKVGAKIDRFHELEKQLDALRATNDRAKAEPLLKEIREIGPQLFESQKKAMESKAVKAKVEAFEKRLKAKMAEIDPEVPQLIKQMEAAAPTPPPGH